MTWRETPRELRADVLEALALRAEWEAPGAAREAFEAAIRELQRDTGKRREVV